VLSPFLKIGMTTPVCQSNGASPLSQATWKTRVNQSMPSPPRALSSSGRISSTPAALPDLRRLIARLTSSVRLVLEFSRLQLKIVQLKFNNFRSHFIFLDFYVPFCVFQ